MYNKKIKIMNEILYEYKKFKIKEKEKIILEGGEPIEHQVDIALKFLAPFKRKIIVKDFIDLDDKGWWNIFYSDSNYYRLRKDAIDEFLDLLK